MEKITPSFWKHLWSYISPVHLETTHSAYNPVLQVYWSKGEYQLLTENAIYSFGRYYSNFGKVFQEIDFKAFKAENILILGFGLGSIPMILEKKLPYKHYYTAVEIDPEVLRLANKYAMPHLPKDFCIDFICNDAELFIEVCQDEYDLICMDIFLDATVPTAFEELVFLENLKNLLAPNGLLIFNKLATQAIDRKQAQQFFDKKFSQIFPDATLLDIDGNYMLLNQKIG